MQSKPVVAVSNLGVPGGVPGGVAGGVPGGVPAEPVTLHRLHLHLRRQLQSQSLSRLRYIKVSGGVIQGNAIRKPAPPYPPIAKAARAQGAVQVQVTISEEGRVIDAQVVSGHPLASRGCVAGSPAVGVQANRAFGRASEGTGSPDVQFHAPIALSAGPLSLAGTCNEDRAAGNNHEPGGV